MWSSDIFKISAGTEQITNLTYKDTFILKNFPILINLMNFIESNVGKVVYSKQNENNSVYNTL